MRGLWLILIAALASAQARGGKESMALAWATTQYPLLFPIAAEDYETLTSPFGLRVSPLLRVLAHHDGIDVEAVPKAQVVSAADGWIAELWPPPDGYYRGHLTYGGMVVIDHGNGFVTLYAHLSAVFVAGWQRVKRGQVIGRVGSTGKSTGEHLHFEVRIRGTLANPLLYMAMPK